ncbi:hypothetical protein [Streptomyces sp. 8L]|uniref:hypothetical protein n=1 Tax=Streptomyces sp. 8L TaxID=2877242 RepID=UPI001CD4AFD0|nr:hypothetical protein [Streptomyces sp. 8L]MCA1224304.1 hypothetical protein [Streptomyces sp. 8L]
MAEKDTDIAALVTERLGSWKDRHRGLLFLKGEEGKWGRGKERRREEGRGCGRRGKGGMGE